MSEQWSSVETQLDALRAEVARLGAAQERQAAAQRRARAAVAGALALAGCAVAFLVARPAQSAVSIHELRAPFRVVGQGGVTLFRVSQNGIAFSDSSGLPLARLGSDDLGRGLKIVDPKGGVVGLLGTAPAPDGTIRGLLTLDPNGVPTTVVGQQPLPGVTDRGLFFYREDGTIGGTIAHNPVLHADGVMIADAAGQNSVITLGINFPINSAGLEINNLALQPEVRLGATPETGLFQLLDKDGDLFFQQPPAP
jgi:hypothetical protein